MALARLIHTHHHCDYYISAELPRIVREFKSPVYFIFNIRYCLLIWQDIVSHLARTMATHGIQILVDPPEAIIEYVQPQFHCSLIMLLTTQLTNIQYGLRPWLDRR